VSESTRKNDETKPSQPGPADWPLCAEAQADGVPCYELGRDCDVCGKAAPEIEQGAQAERPDDEGPLPVSGA